MNSIRGIALYTNINKIKNKNKKKCCCYFKPINNFEFYDIYYSWVIATTFIWKWFYWIQRTNDEPNVYNTTEFSYFKILKYSFKLFKSEAALYTLRKTKYSTWILSKPVECNFGPTHLCGLSKYRRCQKVLPSSNP